jgi:hypothetical protein
MPTGQPVRPANAGLLTIVGVVSGLGGWLVVVGATGVSAAVLATQRVIP